MLEVEDICASLRGSLPYATYCSQSRFVTVGLSPKGKKHYQPVPMSEALQHNTPGSSAGSPLSLLHSAPKATILSPDHNRCKSIDFIGSMLGDAEKGPPLGG